MVSIWGYADISEIYFKKGVNKSNNKYFTSKRQNMYPGINNLKF